MYIRVPFNPVRELEWMIRAPGVLKRHKIPIRELEWMIRAPGVFKRHKIPIEERAHAISTRPAYRPGR